MRLLLKRDSDTKQTRTNEEMINFSVGSFLLCLFYQYKPVIVKNKHFKCMYIEGTHLPRVVALRLVLLLPAAALRLSTGPILKRAVPSSHLDIKTWENRVQVENTGVPV